MCVTDTGYRLIKNADESVDPNRTVTTVTVVVVIIVISFADISTGGGTCARLEKIPKYRKYRIINIRTTPD